MSKFEKTDSGIIIIIGPPGSGKGAMSGDYIEQHSTAQHVSAGDLVRGIRSGEMQSSYSSIVQDSLQKRILMPDETFADIVIERITSSNNDVDLTLLDGFPQQLGDWEHFNKQLSRFRLRIFGAVCLWATEETCVERMKFRGMRNGEYVRNQHSELEEYYRDRYRKYLEKYHILADMFSNKNVTTSVFDVNQNIIDQETRQKVSGNFSKTVNLLIKNNKENEEYEE
ncbi:AAA family ATPase [bacterium]|nr:AAA family ATPase [bacterium]